MTKRCLHGATLVGALMLAAGCAEAPLEKGPVIERSLGHEIYLVLCEHLAGTEFPKDVTARKAANPVCHQHQPAPIEGDRGYRLEALRQNNLAKVLAEPTLVTVSGRPASPSTTTAVRQFCWEVHCNVPCSKTSLCTRKRNSSRRWAFVS